MAVEGSALERGKPDPDVVLPPAVRRAADRANELAQQAKDAKAANPNSNNTLNDDNVKISTSPTTNSSGMQVTSFDPTNPEPPPEPTPPTQQTQQNAPDMEHQFKSLQGRYSKAEEELRRIAQQNQDLQRLLATVQAPAQPQQGSGVRFPGSQPRVTPKEVEEYGKEFIDVIGRRAMEVQDATLAPVLTQLQQNIQRLEAQLGGVRQVQATDANERMWGILDREVPNWQAINNSNEFVQWLQMPDPLSGQIRHGMLDQAFKGQQVGRVIEFFRHFLADYGVARQMPTPQITHQNNGQGNGQGGGLDLMALAAPGRAKAGQTTLAPSKPYYSPADIKQFYHDKTFGKYAGREAEALEIEKDLMLAQREGRIKV